MKPQNHVICTKHRRYAEATKAFVHKRHRTGATGRRCWIENKPDIESKPNARCSRTETAIRGTRAGVETRAKTVGAEITSKRKLLFIRQQRAVTKTTSV